MPIERNDVQDITSYTDMTTGEVVEDDPADSFFDQEG